MRAEIGPFDDPPYKRAPPKANRCTLKKGALSSETVRPDGHVAGRTPRHHAHSPAAQRRPSPSVTRRGLRSWNLSRGENATGGTGAPRSNGSVARSFAGLDPLVKAKIGHLIDPASCSAVAIHRGQAIALRLPPRTDRPSRRQSGQRGLRGPPQCLDQKVNPGARGRVRQAVETVDRRRRGRVRLAVQPAKRLRSVAAAMRRAQIAAAPSGPRRRGRDPTAQTAGSAAQRAQISSPDATTAAPFRTNPPVLSAISTRRARPSRNRGDILSTGGVRGDGWAGDCLAPSPSRLPVPGRSVPILAFAASPWRSPDDPRSLPSRPLPLHRRPVARRVRPAPGA